MATGRDCQEFRVGEWTVSTGSNEMTRGDERVRLESRLVRTLALLHARSGEVVTREQMIADIWDGRVVSDHSISVVISDLRKALGDSPQAPRYIETVPKRGYRLVVRGGPGSRGDGAKSVRAKRGFALSVIALGLIAAVSALRHSASPSSTSAVLTVSDIQNVTEDRGLDRLVLALSELGAHYLSQVDDVRLIRYWWNLDAPDPTGGIPERFGPDVPIYHLAGSLLDSEGVLSLTLFASDPATDEVLWSEAYTVKRERFAEAYLAALRAMLLELGLDLDESERGLVAESGEASELYWVGQYLWNLETIEAAESARMAWEQALVLRPGFPAARAGLQALGAQWPEIGPEVTDETPLQPATDDVRFLIASAATALYRDRDPDRSGKLARQAVSVAPSAAHAHALLAESLALIGQLESALEAIGTARTLAPYAVTYRWHEALYLFVSGDAAAARSALPEDAAGDPVNEAIRVLVLEATSEVEAALEAKARLDKEPRAYLSMWEHRLPIPEN